MFIAPFLRQLLVSRRHIFAGGFNFGFKAFAKT